MRIFVLTLMIIALAPAVLASPFPIDDEFVTDFVEYNANEAKRQEKEQKVQAKIDKKRAKLEAKKAALEKKRNASIENCERSQIYIEKLRSTETNL